MLNRLDANIIDTYNLNSSFSYLGEEDTDKSTNGTPVPDKMKEDGKRKGVIGKIGGIGADSNEPTRNGRRYPLELWQNVEKSEYFIEGMENRCIVGECDHPAERLDYSIPEGAIVLTKYDIHDDGKVYTEFDILDTLPGRTLKTYFDAGCKLGVSSRGLGEEVMVNGEKIIDPETYQFFCFDAVIFPAVKSARMELIESTSPKKQQLINSITKEINNCKTLDECLFIENMSKDVNLYLDEIKESLESKKEEFKILDCDNPEAAYKATKDFLNEIEKLGPNKTERDIKFANYLKDRLNEYESVFKESNELNDEKDNTEELAKSIINKIDKKSHKTKEDSQLSDFLKAWLGESKESITDLFNQLKESIDEDIKNKIESKQINENNKIELSDDKTKSDEDTPEEVKDSDNLQILNELQPDVANLESSTNDINIETLKTTCDKQLKVIKNLLSKLHSNEISLEEQCNISKKLISNHQNEQRTINETVTHLKSELHKKINELSSLNKKYSNLQNVNRKFESIVESLKSQSDELCESINASKNKELSKNSRLIEALNNKNSELKNTSSKLLSENKKLEEKLESVILKNESLGEENKSLLEDKKSMITEIKNINKKYQESLDKYIDSICLKYNLTKEVLLNQLGENYSIEDIDKIAIKLADNNARINSLPFSNLVPDRQLYVENIGLQQTPNESIINENLNIFDLMINSKD